MKTAQDYLRELEDSSAQITDKITLREYEQQLLQLQDAVCKMVAGNKYHEKMYVKDAERLMEKAAWEKGLLNDPAVKKGIQAIRDLKREIPMIIAGVKAEDRVFRTLEDRDPPHTAVYRNVYVTDGEQETELDAVVATNAGIVVLEVKSVKRDLTLDKGGRMVFSGNVCVPLGEKMEKGRRILEGCLNRILADKGHNIPVHIDSYAVFCPHENQDINVTDNYKQEKWCLHDDLLKTLKNYKSDVCYDDNELRILNGALAEIPTDAKRKHNKIKYDKLRPALAEAMVTLQEAPAVKEEPKVEGTDSMRTLFTERFGKMPLLAKVAAGLIVPFDVAGAVAWGIIWNCA